MAHDDGRRSLHELQLGALPAEARAVLTDDEVGLLEIIYYDDGRVEAARGGAVPSLFMEVHRRDLEALTEVLIRFRRRG